MKDSVRLVIGPLVTEADSLAGEPVGWADGHVDLQTTLKHYAAAEDEEVRREVEALAQEVRDRAERFAADGWTIKPPPQPRSK